jgi:UDP-glucose 4-epimerase
MKQLNSNLSSPSDSLVIGSGGLLGSAIANQLGSRFRPKSRFEWDTTPVLSHQFSQTLSSFFQQLTTSKWRIYWAAGAGHVGASDESLKRETAHLQLFLEALSQECPPTLKSSGRIFFASSAGGVYGGSGERICTEKTEVKTINNYGSTKLIQEKMVVDMAMQFELPVLVGRISNLYGSNQNLGKRQGLISQLCSASISNKPVVIYVPLQTSRDYIYADDAAHQIIDSLEAINAKLPTIKIICSGRNTAISEVVSEIRKISRKPLRYTTGSDQRASLQPLDVRLQSTVEPMFDEQQMTPLVVGIHRVYKDIFQMYAQHGLRV